MATLTVSNATAGFLARGHPWVRPDRFTRGLERLQIGEAVDLVDQRQQPLASALADPHAEICARVYARTPGVAFDPAAALKRAWTRRAALHQDPETDCYRLVHGEADGLPGVRIERFGTVLVVMLLAGCAEPYLEVILATTQELFPAAQVLLRSHRDDLRRAAVADRPYGAWRIDPERIITGRELGSTYPLRPLGGLATGLYCDQRATRARLGGMAAGRTVLNLFAYTGAFSIHLLRLGASRAVDVDSASVALARGAEAAARNAVAERRLGVRDDCRRYLERSTESFDLVICDPPTSSQGDDGWILRRDYPKLLGLCLQALAPGGLIVACVNTLGGKPFPLTQELGGAAEAQGVALRPEPGFALAADIPQLEGFPEGRPYRLAALRRT